MAVFNDFKLSFPSDEQDFIQELINQCQNNESINTFHHFAVLTSSEIADIIGDLSGSTHPFYVELSEYIFNKAASVSSGTDDEKWAAYTELFPEDYQASIDELITTIKGTYDYDTYKLQDATYVAGVLDAYTPSSAFFTDFSAALQGRAGRMFDGWQALHNLYSGEEQKAIAELLEHFQVTLDIPKFEDFVALGATGIADEIREIYADTLYIQNIAKTFRDKAVDYINGYTSADVLEDTFINSYREDMREGVRQFIQTLKDSEVITTLSDIKTISLTPGTLTLPGTQPGNPQTVTPQIPTVGMAFVLEINDKDVVYYKAAATTVSDVTAGLTSVINGATAGEWTSYTATDNTTDLSISGAGNFTLSNLTNNYFPYLQAIIANLSDTHPLYLGLAQSLYNDALPLVGSGVQNYTLKGRLYKLDEKANEIPLAGYKVEAFDLTPSEESIGTAFSNDDGYFTIAYTLPNAATTSKTFRFKVYDEDDSLLDIAPQVKTNLFTDGDNGSFENGTAPDFTEWNLVKGTDIKINTSERLGENLQENGDFSSSSGGWKDSATGSLVSISGGNYNLDTMSNGSKLLSTIILEIGKKYSLKVDLQTVDIGQTLTIYNSDGSTIQSGSPIQELLGSYNSTGIKNHDFIAKYPNIHFYRSPSVGDCIIDDVSIQEYLENEISIFEGEYSPEFYLDADVPTTDLVFDGDTSITVTADTDYEIFAYIYFASAIVQSAGLIDSGIYLKPTTYTFNDLTQSEVANGSNLLRFGASSLYKGAESSATGLWTRISARFNSGVNTSMKIGVYLKGTLSNFSPRFGFYIDKIQLTEVPQSSLDLSLTPGSTDTTGILVEGLLPSALSAAVSQASGASQPQISVIIPEHVQEGDTFVATINNIGAVSYQATSSSEEEVVDGLVTAITKETADVTFYQQQTSSSSQPQIIQIIPQDVLAGARYVLAKTMRNLFLDGDMGTFENTSDGSGNPPSDWGLTKTSIISSLQHAGGGYRGTYALVCSISATLPVGPTLTFYTNSLIKIKRNTRYKISAYINQTGGDPRLYNNAEFYFLPKGFEKNQMDLIQPRKVSSDTAYREVKTIFNSGNNDTCQLYFFIDLKEALTGTGGAWFIDDLRLEEYPEKTPTIEYTAQTTGSVSDVVIGLMAAIVKASADLTVAINQTASTTLKHIIHITPADVQIGAEFTLQINEKDTITFVASAATVANVTAGLTAAINAATTGEWLNVSATDATTHVVITADNANQEFTIKQIGGEWSEVTATNPSNSYVLLVGDENDMPFTITQVGGAWKAVTPSDQTTYVQVTADADDAPFTLDMKVIPADDVSMTVSALTDQIGMVLPGEVSLSFGLKNIYTLSDIIALGGLKNNLDGEVDIQNQQAADSTHPQIDIIEIATVRKGDIFTLDLNSNGTLTYVATDDNVANTYSALIDLINNTSTGDWSLVTASSGSVVVTANSNNTPFTLTQTQQGAASEIVELDAYANLNFLVADLGLSDDKTVAVLSAMIDNGYTSALAIANATEADFIKTMYQLVGDFNAARLYKLAEVRRNIMDTQVKKFLAGRSSYNISLGQGGFKGSISKLNTFIGERCSCSECEAAISPLAYLTDLINYTLKNLRLFYPDSSEKYRSISLQALELYFHQNFVELPASCDDLKNKVCQVRICIEVLRRYLGSNLPSYSQQLTLVEKNKEYFFRAYSALLEGINTSYDEVRSIRTETEKKDLASKLGFTYTGNEDFITKLFLSPIDTTPVWDDYKKLYNGTLQNMLTEMIDAFAGLGSPVSTFAEFSALSESQIKTDLTSLSSSSDFMMELSGIIHRFAGIAYNTIHLFPSYLDRDEISWNFFLSMINSAFTPSFGAAFALLKAARQPLSTGNKFSDFAFLSVADLATYLLTLTSDPYDFWLNFSRALKSRTNEIHIVTDNLSERNLEEVFGLTDTGKDIFSDGVKIGDDKNYIDRWNIRGFKWGQNTDENGYIYLKMLELEDAIEIYKDEERTSENKVAVANLDTASLKFIISEYNDSGLSGELIVNTLENNNVSIKISAIPLVLSWQLQLFRKNWLLTDQASDTPVIDPDLILPVDFKDPFNFGNVTITTAQAAGASQPQIDHITPVNLLSENTFVLDLNGNGTILYKSASATVSEVVTGLTDAINNATDGDWASVTATDGSTHVVVTYNANNTPFELTYKKSPIGIWTKRKEDLDDKLNNNTTGIFAQIEANNTHEEWGSQGSGEQQLDSPEGIITDASGIVYVADTVNGRIRKLDTSLDTFSAFVSGLTSPKGLAFDAAGNILVSVAGEDAVKAFDTAGSLLWSFGASGTGLGEFNSPTAIALDENNNLFVSDTGNNTIKRFNLPKDLSGYIRSSSINIFTKEQPSSDQEQVSILTPLDIKIGDKFVLNIDGADTLTYTATSVSLAETTAGIASLINGASGGWTAVTASDKGTEIEVKANAVDVSFTIEKETYITGFTSVSKITSDKNSNLYIADKVNNRILKLDMEGNVLKTFGTTHNFSEDLVAYLRMDENSGTTARDSSSVSSANSGTLTATGASWSPSGKVNTSLALDGSGYVTIASDAQLDADDFSERTIELWFNAADKTSAVHQILYKQGDYTQGLNIYIKSGILYVGSYGTSGSAWSNFLSTNAIRSGQWHHVVVVFDNTPLSGKKKFSAYLDGKLFDSSDNGSSIEASAAPDGINLGALYNGTIQFQDSTISTSDTNYYFEGNLDNLRVWNRALSEEEIALLFSRTEDTSGYLFNPDATAVDKSGNVFVADIGNSRIVKFGADGSFLTQWGTYGSDSSQFQNPAFIITDDDGNIYVSDALNHNVQVFTSQTALLRKIEKTGGGSGSADGEFNAPGALALDSNNLLYVSDNGNNRIQYFDEDGLFAGEFTTYDGGTAFNSPDGLCIDSEGNIIVVDSGSNKIVKLTPAGSTPYVLTAGPWSFSAGSGLSIDSSDFIYMITGGDTIKRTSFPKAFTDVILPKGISLAQTAFNAPAGICIDRFGKIIIADKGNNRILKMNSDGVYVNYIGKTDNTSGTGNGEFNLPLGISTDASGNIYIADTGNSRIQKFDNSGEFLIKWATADFTSPSITLTSPTSLFVDGDRKVYVANGTHKVLKFDALQGIGAPFKTTLGISLAEFLEISFREKQGEKITQDLEDLLMEFKEFRYLLKLIDLCEKGVPLLDEHLDDLGNIFIKIYKKGQYESWKTEENESQISLSPDYFKSIGYLEEIEIELTPWRGTVNERKSWKDKLNARIEQENRKLMDYQSMIDEVEDEVLISLRDSLIMAGDFKGSSLSDKAQDATNKLLIDAKNNCCQRTTRVAQAMETLTGILWGIRTGQLQDTYPFALFNLAHFDEEWQWMGSYANWRAAQLVFMYPENLLLPAYKKDQTPLFKDLINSLQDENATSSKDVCCQTKDFYDYFEDISKIELKAVRQTSTAIISGDDCCNKVTAYKNLLHSFGIGGKTKKIYWSTLDPDQINTDNVQTIWTPLKGFEKAELVKIVGLSSIQLSSKERYLYLFVILLNENKTKLNYLRFDLEKSEWEEELQELSTSDVPDLVDVVITTNPDDLPWTSFILQGSNNYVAEYYLDKGKELKPAGKVFPSPKNAVINKIYNYSLTALLRYVKGEQSYAEFEFSIPVYAGFVNVGTVKTTKYVSLPTQSGTYFMPYQSDPLVNARQVELPLADDNKDFQFAGEFVLKSETNDIGANYESYIFWRAGTTGRYTSYVQNRTSYTYPGSVFSTPVKDVKFIGCFRKGTGYDYYALYQKVNGEIWYAKISRSSENNGVRTLAFSTTDTRRISFAFNGPFDLNEQQDPIKLINLRNAVRQAFVNNKNVPKQARIYFDEALYYVPVAVAMQLQKQGQYEKALDWFRLVYDYSAPDRISRSIYYGLYLEQSTSIIDNFENQRNAVISSSDGQLTIADNPLKTSFNISDKVGKYARGYNTGTIIYDIPAGHTIDFNDPQLIMDIYDQQGPTTIKIVARNKAKSELAGTIRYISSPFIGKIPVGYYPLNYGQFAQYTSTTTGDNWEALEFSSGQLIVNGSVTASEVDQLVVYIDPDGSAKKGMTFYIDNIRSGNDTVEFDKPEDWIQDPLNPHALAATRENANTRFVVSSIVKCILEYADSEYTKDTAESVPRARTLYQTALELLDAEGMGTVFDSCKAKIEALDFELEPEWQLVWEEIRDKMFNIKESDDLNEVIDDINFIMEGSDSTASKLKVIRTIVDSAVDDPVYFRKIHEMITESNDIAENVHSTLLANPKIRHFIKTSSATIADNYLNAVQTITGIKADVLLSDQAFSDDSVMAMLRSTDQQISTGVITPDQITGSLTDLESDFINNNSYDPNNPDYKQELTQQLLKNLKASIADVVNFKINYTPSLNFNFCVPPNPVPVSMRYQAELNLYKIRNCRNIAGVVRELDPYAAPTDVNSGLPQIGSAGQLLLPGAVSYKPTIYRYPVLIERAKQLAQMAQQVEASMLAAIEKFDAESYNLLKAKQDLALSNAGVRLQDLRVNEAQDNVKLAQLQKEKADIQFQYFDDLIHQDLTALEIAALAFQTSAILFFDFASIFGEASIFEEALKLGPGGKFGNITAATSAAQITLANTAIQNSQYFSTLASYERRRQDWRFQRDIAGQDVKIGEQQVTIANDQVQIVGQERVIAKMQVDNAQATIDFLSNKFTNRELYSWMSNILQNAYAFFLRQATAMAQLAETQLAFERQKPPQQIIKKDYWQAPSDSLSSLGGASLGNNSVSDRRGLTGSTRLLQDIFQLDQFAFTTDTRKLQLSKTISLSTMAPAEFQRFRETGEMVFETTMQMFDKDFPGHYLRLIKRVRTSVVALIPPSLGIKATLTNSGISYVVTESNGTFQRIPIVRDTESVALTASSNATGLFEFEQVAPDKLLPFENSGVEGKWIFSMPKAANQFDYTTIADVLVTIEYTALNNNDYRNEVIENIGTGISSDRLFSFKNQFADQWYDLNNPDQTAEPMKVSFSTRASDFPVNILDLDIENILMYFVKSDSLSAEDEDVNAIDTIRVVSLKFTPDGKTMIPAPDADLTFPENMVNAVAANGSVNTRSNGSNWMKLAGHGVAGTWELTLDPADAHLFSNESITDILFVISYSGTTPEWPR